MSPPTLDRYGDALSATFFRVMKQTLRISITGTILCLLIGFPVAYFIAVKVPPRWRGGTRPRHHPVLDELPDPDDRLAHRPVADGFFSNWFQDIGLRDSTSKFSTPAPRCSSPWSTTTCR